MRNAINIAVTPARQHSHAVIANGLVFVSGKGPDNSARNVADEEAG